MATSHVHLILLLILSLFLLPTLQDIPFSYCGGDSSSSIDIISVEEILKDKNKASFKISGSTSFNITGGDINLDVKIGLIRYLKKNYDLCEHVTCPVAPGAFVLPLDNIFPTSPLVRFTVHIDIFDNSEDVNQILCLIFDFKPKRAFAVSG